MVAATADAPPETSDRSPVIGFVQTAVIILGLGLMCGGGYYCNRSFFRRYPESLTSGFGIRFVVNQDRKSVV